MMTRRLMLVLPLVAALPARASRLHDVSELRAATTAPIARALQARLGIRVAPVTLSGAALAQALSEGHVELALLDADTLALARAAMGKRLLVLPVTIAGRTAVIRQALTPALRADMVAALA